MDKSHNAFVPLTKEAMRIEEDSTYSSKSHFNAADIFKSYHYLLGVPATLFGLLASAAIVKDYGNLAGFCSLVASLFAGLITFLKPYERASSHKTLGDQYSALRNDSRIFREIDLLQSNDEEELTKSLKALADRRDELNASSPEIPKRAFEEAKNGIKNGEASYYVDRT